MFFWGQLYVFYSLYFHFFLEFAVSCAHPTKTNICFFSGCHKSAFKCSGINLSKENISFGKLLSIFCVFLQTALVSDQTYIFLSSAATQCGMEILHIRPFALSA